MSKLNKESNKNNELNTSIKSQLDEKRLRKIRKQLLFLTEMDMKDSKSFNIIVVKKDENENKIAMPTILPKRNYYEDSGKNKLNDVNIVDETDSDTSELADSSDFENEGDEF